MHQPFAVRLGIGQRILRRCQLSLGRAHRGEGRRRAGGVDPPERVEQGAVARRCEQPAIVMLAVNFDQNRAQSSQQTRGHRLIVDECPAAPIGLDRAANGQWLPRFDCDVPAGPANCSLPALRSWRTRWLVPRPARTSPPPARIPSAKPSASSRIDFPAPVSPVITTSSDGKIEVERLNQHDVANGEGLEHSASLASHSAAAKPRRSDLWPQAGLSRLADNNVIGVRATPDVSASACTPAHTTRCRDNSPPAPPRTSWLPRECQVPDSFRSAARGASGVCVVGVIFVDDLAEAQRRRNPLRTALIEAPDFHFLARQMVADQIDLQPRIDRIARVGNSGGISSPSASIACCVIFWSRVTSVICS